MGADLPSSFWGGWIVVITIVSLAGLAWLLFSVYFSVEDDDHTESLVWDENLREGNSPGPMWWFWLILASMIFSVIYLILYPGLGTYQGALRWSHGHRLEHSYENYHENYQAIRQSALEAGLGDLQANDKVMSTARTLFDRNCAACHGPEGRGQANTFPDLMDADWQWGGDIAQIEQTIRNGRQAAMPGWHAALGDEGVRQVIAYIRTLGEGNEVAAEDLGKAHYNQLCVACHGMEGKGNSALGAPSLTDDIWLYGNSDAALTQTIATGRNGVMPAFDKRLDDVQIRLLLAWLTRPTDQ